MRKRKGFTLVELMMVAIIVAILAAVAIPLMSGNKRRAYGTEAEAALGMIRSNLRVYLAENDEYPVIASGTPVETNVDGIASGDLTGTYFSGPNYTIESAAAAYTVTCDWDAAGNTAPQEDAISSIDATTTIDEDGEFDRTNY